MTMAADIFRFVVDPLQWQILPRIPLGPVAISPHGIGIAVGYLLGAQLMVRRARQRGGPDEADIWNTLFWALLGALIGARLGYVFGHLPEVTDGGDDPLGVFRVWEGGISLIGGITGAILAALPYMLRKKMGFWRTMDLAAPGLALGIVIGRVGDMVIGDHLGEPTDFALGWHCIGVVGEGEIQPASAYRDFLRVGEPPSLGCFDLTLHQTALYDFMSTLVLLGVLLWVGTKARRPGFLILIFGAWYGTMRVITDFLRVDRRYFGLTGSQWVSVIVVAIALFLLARYRGAPRRWSEPVQPAAEAEPAEPAQPAAEPEPAPPRPEASAPREPAADSESERGGPNASSPRDESA